MSLFRGGDFGDSIRVRVVVRLSQHNARHNVAGLWLCAGGARCFQRFQPLRRSIP